MLRKAITAILTKLEFMQLHRVHTFEVSPVAKGGGKLGIMMASCGIEDHADKTGSGMWSFPNDICSTLSFDQSLTLFSQRTHRKVS